MNAPFGPATGRVERWARTAMLIAAVVLFPSAVRAVVVNPSLGNWLTVALAVIVVGGSTVSALSAWRHRNTVRVPAKVSPAEVALPDVSAAIASSSGRIDAIRRLRQMYPGLGLLDAKELVDRQLPGPG
ncbi:hypothetical protein [Prescottella equi]|uniref:Uncharacterized protein n=1 Tax=Rhodococcus hoagii TaxID=43767 RepID=A0AAE5IS92_RHOHA|nr:hypothetical protein [Prescottella equi]GBF15244.1 hypothetical protein Br6_02626 [Rhodococcus sp. Br-6]ERN45773.1 hypothetical protein H849_11626 [Prescottella equi NBRC 101255 = C 7]MBM4523207.1 hypothetical protein [Prescottella equi]MBM4587053.1 hypothetical protein [Prescottella equi]MBM4591330.1 hypothetical protein [Prescottella equi]